MYHDEERSDKGKERKRLEKMSLEQLRVELDERMKASLIAELEKLPERINNHLDDCVYKIITAALGIKKDGWHDGKWEIDTHHEKAAIAIELGEHVMAQVKLAIPDFIQGLVIGDPRIPPIKTAYTKAYKEHLAELINTKTWEMAQTSAEKRFVEIIKEIGGEKKEVSLEEDDEDDLSLEGDADDDMTCEEVKAAENFTKEEP